MLILCIWVSKMFTLTYGEWVADLRDMTCRNVNTGLVVEFHKSGATHTGKMKDIPFGLMRQWAKTECGELFIKKAVMEAEKVFLKAFIESGMEKKEVIK